MKMTLAALLLMLGCQKPPQLTMDAIRAAKYDLPIAGQITFTNGEYERAADTSLGRSYIHVGLVDLFAFGDLDGDRAEDAVTFLAQSLGGPEIILSMEVFKNDEGTPRHVVSYVVGDRVGIDSVTIADGIIDLYVITQGPGDAICCPTKHVRRTLHLRTAENGVVVDTISLPDSLNREGR